MRCIRNRGHLVLSIGRAPGLSEVDKDLVTRIQSMGEGRAIGDVNMVGDDETAAGQLGYETEAGELLGISGHDGEPVIVRGPHNLIDAVGGATAGESKV